MRNPKTKTRTRKTIGGGTKTVIKSRNASGSRVRSVEKTSADGRITTNKIRRRDESGVTKKKTMSATGLTRSDANIRTQTVILKDKTRDKGKLRFKDNRSKYDSADNSLFRFSKKYNTPTLHSEEIYDRERDARLFSPDNPKEGMPNPENRRRNGKGGKLPTSVGDQSNSSFLYNGGKTNDFDTKRRQKRNLKRFVERSLPASMGNSKQEANSRRKLKNLEDMREAIQKEKGERRAVEKLLGKKMTNVEYYKLKTGKSSK